MSIRSEYINVVQDVSGTSLADVQVNVYETGTTTPVTIYTLRTGGSTRANPFTTDSTGEVLFFIEPGTYDMKLHDTQTPSRFSDKTVTIEGVSGDVVTGGLDVSQIERFGPGEIPIADGAGVLQGQTISGDLTIDEDGVAAISPIVFSGISSVPPGVCVPFAANTPPAGWLHCDGSSVLRTTYSDLFDVIGTTYGSADGTHFTLPDMRGRFPLGVDGSANRINSNPDLLAQTGGEELHIITSAELPTHTHSVNITSGIESVSHSHTQTGTFASGTESADHSHSVSGSTATESSTHTHITGIGFTILTNTATTPGGGQRIATIGQGQANTANHTSGSESSTHSHSFSATSTGRSVGHTHSTTISGSTGTQSANHTHSVSGNTGSVGSGTGHNTLPPYIALRMIIKY